MKCSASRGAQGFHHPLLGAIAATSGSGQVFTADCGDPTIKLRCSQHFPQLLDMESSSSGVAPGAARFGVSDNSLVLEMKLQPEKRQDHF